MGICIPPEEYRLGFLNNFEQSEFRPHENGESVIYDIRKFFKLAADNNPNILELLWTAEEDILEIDSRGELLRKNREAFLSKKCLYTYRGYAVSQLKRIQTHRKWLLDPPEHKPEREEFNIPNINIPSEQLNAALTAIKNKIDSWEIDFKDTDETTKIYIYEQIQNFLVDITESDKFKKAGSLLGFDDNFIHYLELEREYRQSLAHYNQYQTWKKERNPKRAIRSQDGYDGKHAAHLYRLMLTCREILTEGKVYVRRKMPKNLAIRNGKYTYDEIIKWTEEQDKDLIKVAKHQIAEQSR